MENMTKAQLQAICDQKKIAYNSKSTKQDLLAAIEACKKASKKKLAEKPVQKFSGEY